MSFGTRLLFEPSRILLGSAMTGSYQAVGTPFNNQARQLIVQNLTDGNISISIDGVSEAFPMLTNAVLIMDICSNRVDDDGYFISKSTQVYASNLTTAPIGTATTGAVYVSVIYALGD